MAATQPYQLLATLVNVAELRRIVLGDGDPPAVDTLGQRQDV